MKVQTCVSENNVQPEQRSHNQAVSPNFQAGGVAFNVVGNAMQWVQDKGYIASFLIQDGLGMTAPRVGTGFMRDKEVTGEYNFQ